MNRIRWITFFLVLSAVFSGIAGAMPVSGALFTTDRACRGANINIFAVEEDVYLDGGAGYPGGTGLPDGQYYVQVTDPAGALLGRSANPAIEIAGGEFTSCRGLYALTAFGTSATGEYTVWISMNSDFRAEESKTDNFKIEPNPDCPFAASGLSPSRTCPPNAGLLQVRKFYDANANGINDDNQPIAGWQVRIEDGVDYIRSTPASIILHPDDYTVTESTTLELNWLSTMANPVSVTLADQEAERVEFGNVCLGGGGGHTIGFWSGKNGYKAMSRNMSEQLAMLSGLNLVDETGAAFDPPDYPAFESWLKDANATNMAYMLSAQLAAMELNVFNLSTNGNGLVHAPGLLPCGVAGVNGLGFIPVSDLMSAADASFGSFPYTPSGHPERACEEALKTALDSANNNFSFVQSLPCPISFEP